MMDCWHSTCMVIILSLLDIIRLKLNLEIKTRWGTWLYFSGIKVSLVDNIVKSNLAWVVSFKSSTMNELKI